MGKQVNDVFMAEFNGVEVTFQASNCYVSADGKVKIPIINTDNQKEGVTIPRVASFHELHFFLGNSAIARKTIEKITGKINGAKKNNKSLRRPMSVH